MPRFFPTILYFLILYPLFGFITITYVGQPAFYLYTLLLLSVFIVFLITIKKFTIPKYIRYQILYLLLVFISIYVVNGKGFKINNDLAQLVWIANAVMLFIIIENTRFSESFIETSKVLMLLVVMAAALVSVVQYYNPVFFLNFEKYSGAGNIALEGFERRIVSIFSWGDLMNTQYMAIGFAIFYGILIKENERRRIISVAMPIMVGLVMLLSGYRVGMLTFLITTISLYYKKLSVKPALIIATTLIFINVSLSFLNFDKNYFIESRLKSETAFTRIDAFKAFAYAFPKKPYFGTGGEREKALFEGFGGVARMHNVHLNIAYYFGIFAFLAHSIFLLYLFMRTYTTGKFAGYWPPFVGLICYLAASFTTPRAEFFEPGLVMMMVFNKYHMDRYQTGITNAIKTLT